MGLALYIAVFLLAGFYKKIIPADSKGLLFTPQRGIFRGCAIWNMNC
jgi:hypothetical protein